jgi:hypothetical protein
MWPAASCTTTVTGNTAFFTSVMLPHSSAPYRISITDITSIDTSTEEFGICGNIISKLL